MRKKIWIPIGILAVIIIATICIFKPFKIVKILSDLKDGDYNAVYVSQYSTANFDFESYERFMGDKVYPIEVFSGNYLEMCEVLYFALKCEGVDCAYVGLDMKHLRFDPALKFLISHKLNEKWYFHIGCVYAGELKGDISKKTEAVKELVNTFGVYENVVFEWPGYSEALTVVPTNYDENGLTANQTIYYLLDPYKVNTSNVENRCSAFEEAVMAFRDGTYTYPDLSDVTFLFLGDSIIAKTEPENSIPSLLKMYCNAESVDLSVGGATCADHAADSDNCMAAQMQEIPFDSLNDSERIIVIINFGLNDFFEQNPARGNSSDCYEYALNKHINEISEILPSAEIYVMSPTFVNGNKGDKVSLNGKEFLSDYRDVARSIAQQNGCVYVDNYKDLCINENNFRDFYEDEVHLNPQGRLLYVRNLIQYISMN